MKSPTPAVAPGTLTNLARGKTRKVQRKLRAAEDQLHKANSALLDALPKEVRREVRAALLQSSAAETQVREAEEELSVVSQLLTIEAMGGQEQNGAATTLQGSGEGARSLLWHIGGPEGSGQP